MSVCVCIPHKRTRIRLATDFQQHLVLSTMESCLENCDFSVLHILSPLTLLTTLRGSMLDIKWKLHRKVTWVSNHSDCGQSHPRQTVCSWHISMSDMIANQEINQHWVRRLVKHFCKLGAEDKFEVIIKE